MVMQGFPPESDAVVSSANWQDAPFNRWAFWHVREVLPTQRIAAAAPGESRPLPPSAVHTDLRAVPLSVAVHGEVDGAVRTVGDVLDDTYTDAWVVLHNGELVEEWYAPDGAANLPHAVMSVTKSVVGGIAGVLAEQGRLSPDHLLTDHVPELAGTAWAGATVRQVLDMRSGVSFFEDYTDPASDLQRLDEWLSSSHDGDPRGLYSFLLTLREGREHGGSFLYRSAETDVLGWVCERASGRRMADMISDLIWAPMGAEHPAEMICDTLGTAIHNGGLCATARDLARFGQLLLDGGAVSRPDGPAQVLPAAWLRAAWAVDADVRSAFLSSPAEQAFPGGWYRNKLWFRPGEHGDVLLCLGIHGQMIHVSRRTRTVCVKLSCWPSAQDPHRMQETLVGCDAVGSVLAGLDRTGPRRGLAGVVSGHRRPGISSHHGSAV